MDYSESVTTLERSRRLGGGNPAAWAMPLLLLVILFTLSSGCRRGKAPSEQFTQAHALFSRLYAAKLDDAFADPQMGRVEELLQQVPENSLDFPSARELLVRIREGRAGLETAAQARRAAQAQALASGSYQRMDDRAVAVGGTAPAEDAGVAHPTAGMATAEFTGRFSNCFQMSDAINVIGHGKMDSWELKDIANCRDRHPGFDGTLVLTDARQVSMVVPKSAVEWRLADGGTQPGGAQSPR